VKAYRYADFRVTSSAIGRCCCLHLLRVRLIGPHYIALVSIVGVVPPMEPAIVLTWSGGERHVRVSWGGRGNQHTVVRAVVGVTCHSSHRLGQPLNFDYVWCNVREGGSEWCGSESHWTGGTPTRVPVLLLLFFALLGLARAAFSRGCCWALCRT
jgi:hypothetical protein